MSTSSSPASEANLSPKPADSSFKRRALWFVTALLLCASDKDAFAQATASSGSGWVVALIVCALFAMFAGALWVVYKLWMTVLDIVANKSADKANRLAAILGSSEVGVDAKAVRIRAVGVGLSATIAILALAVAAMYVLNNQTVT